MKSLLLSFFFLVSVGMPGFSSTNTPTASSAVVSVNATTLQFQASGLLASNAIARVNHPVTIADITFGSNMWHATGINVWTNSSGWSCSGSLSNGVLDCYTNPITSPLITGPGLREIAITWSNLYFLDQHVQWSTNDVAWETFSSLSDLRETWPSYRLRVSTVQGMLPPETPPAAMLARILVTGHRHPSLIGSTNDYAGIAIRVDNPVSSRDAVNLQAMNSALEPVMQTAQNPISWSSFPALSAVNINGKTIELDPRYTLAINGDILTLGFADSPVWEIIGGGTVAPVITSFTIAGGTQIAMRVMGSTGWRPYPEWTDDLVTGSWTRLTTNAFSSTYPLLDGGHYNLTFATVTNSPVYYRITALDETGSSNTLSMAIRVPLQLDQPPTGAGIGGFATTQSLATSIAPLASTTMLNAAVSPLASTQQLYAVVSTLTNLFQGADARWFTLTPVTTLTVSAISGMNYNGPGSGTVFRFSSNIGDEWNSYSNYPDANSIVGTLGQQSESTNYGVVNWIVGTNIYPPVIGSPTVR